jgi:hypothetical protein
MMIASIPLGTNLLLDVSGFTSAEMRMPLVELRADWLDRPLNLTPDQATEIAAALITAAARARSVSA